MEKTFTYAVREREEFRFWDTVLHQVIRPSDDEVELWSSDEPLFWWFNCGLVNT
jgi:hypothetical protein